jgi:hypothetical protein
MLRVSPDKAKYMRAGHLSKMSLELCEKLEKELPNVTIKKLSFLEKRSLTMLVQQCYDQNSLSCNEIAFVSKVPLVCECYRTPFFHLTQEEFYAVVVQTFEAHPECANLAWNSTEAIHDARFPQLLVHFYP